MTLGLTIPGVDVVHPREAWEEPGYRISDMTRPPTLYRPGNVTRGAIHYSSAMNLPDGDIGEFDHQIVPWLRSSQRDYLTNRTGGGYTRASDGRYFPGYHLGYSFAFDWLGGVWELRGYDYLPAATNGHNDYTLACLMITDRPDEASPFAWASVRAVLREARRRGGNRSDFADRPWGHGEFAANTGEGTPTICPGPPVLAQVHMGLADLSYDEGVHMGLEAINPVRAYDSRPGQPVDAPYDVENGGVLRTPMLPGQRRQIVVGLATQAAINVTVVGHGGAGFIAVSPDGVLPRTSVVNYDAADRVEANSTITRLENGRAWLHCQGAPADVIVDVTALG